MPIRGPRASTRQKVFEHGPQEDEQLLLYPLHTPGPYPRVDGRRRKPMNEGLKPVLIAGAGPTGMMAAIELSRFNIPVRLIEKKAEPETTSRAIGVQARTLELLEQRGLGSSLVEHGNHGRAFSLYGDGKRIWRLELGRISSKYNYLL